MKEELARKVKKLAMPKPPMKVRPRKRASRSSRPKPPKSAARLTRRRCSTGRVSFRAKATRQRPTIEIEPTATNTARQPNGTISALPASGARIGATLKTSIIKDISRVAS